MIRNNNFSKILLSIVVFVLCVLGLSVSVKAGNTWTTTDTLGKLNLEGKVFSGENNGVKWSAEITKADPISKEEIGKVIFTINNPENISGEINLPSKVENKAGLSQDFGTEYAYEVEKISVGSFENANRITKVTFGEYVTTIETGFFNNCDSLEEINIGKNIKEIGSKAFQKCSSLKKINVVGENPYFSSDEQGVLYNKDKTILISYPTGKELDCYIIPSTVKEIGEYAFYGNQNLVEIQIPDTVEKLGRGIFEASIKLETVKFLGDSKIKIIPDRAFLECINLKNINILESITEIGRYAFYNCTSLEKIELPTSIIGIGGFAFAHCSKLEAINIPENVTIIGAGTFAECTSLKQIKLHKNITKIETEAFAGSGLQSIEIPKDAIKIGSSAFYGCSDLKTVVISNAMQTIGLNAFRNCNNNLVVYCYNCDENYINNINANTTVIPAYILCEQINDYVKITKFSEGSCTEIELLKEVYGAQIWDLGEASFKGNTKIQKIKLPNTIMQMGKEVFCGCVSLNNIVLPKALTNIPDQAFYKCESLSKVVIKKGSEIETIGAQVFTGCPEGLVVYHDGENSVINEYAKANSNFRIDNEAPTASMKCKLNNKKSATIILNNIKDNTGGSEAEFYAISLSPTVDGVKESEWKLVTSDIVTQEVLENETWYIYISDMVGNTATNNYLVVSGIDKTAPIMSEDVEIDCSKNGALITAKVKEETDGSGLIGYAFSQNSEAGDIKEWKNISGMEAEIKGTLLENGTYYLHVKDNAGNIGTFTIVVNGIDNVDPSIGNVLVIPTLDKYVTLKANIYDEGGSKLDSYAIDLNETITDTTNWVKIEGDLNRYDIEKIIEANGIYYIHVKDKFGNTFTGREGIDGIVDQIAPRVEFGERTNNKIEVKITDAFKGIAEGAKISYAWSATNDVEPETYEQIELKYEAGAKEVSFEIEGQGQGTYYLWIKIEELKDVAGNENKEGKIVSDSYDFDTVAPKIEKVEISKEKLSNGQKAFIKLTFSESVKQVEEIITFIENTNVAQGCLLTGWSPYDGTEDKVWEAELAAGTGNGEISIIIPAGAFKDETGNTLAEDKEITGIVIDNIAPNLPSIVIPEDIMIRKDQTTKYVIVSEEELVLVEDKIKDITLTNGEISGSIESVTSEDKKTWVVTVKGGAGDGVVILKLPTGLFKDTLGNEVQEVTYQSLMFDNIVPTIEFSGPNISNANSSSTIIFTIKSKENLQIKEGNIEIKAVDSTNTITGKVEVSKKIEEPENPILGDIDNDGKLEIKDAAMMQAYSLGGIELDKETIARGDMNNDGKINLTDVKMVLQIIYKLPGMETEWEVKVTEIKGDGAAKLVVPANYFVDEAGNGNAFAEKEGLTVDNTAPIITNIGEVALDETKQKATVEITLEKELGLKYLVSTSDKVENATEEWKDVLSNPIKAEFTQKGTYYIYVKDSLGNIAKAENPINIEDIFDKVVPTIEVKKEVVDGGIKVTITANEEIQLPEGWEYVDGDKKVISKVFTEDIVTEIIVKDKSGNDTKVDLDIKIDKEVPTIEVKKEVVDGGIKVTIITNEEIQLPEGWEYVDGDKKVISKVFTEDIVTEIIVKDKSENETKVQINLKLVTKVNLNVQELTLEIGKNQKLTATIEPAEATEKTVKWSSSNPSIVEVDKQGNLRAKAAGEAIITVSSVQGNKTAQCKVKVKTVTEDKLSVELKNESTYKIETEAKTLYIANIKPKTTIQTAINNIKTNGDIKIYKGSQEITDKTKNIATGMTLKVTKGTEIKEYVIVVRGDVTGDGLMTDADLLKLARYNAGIDTKLEGAKLKASNVFKDDKYANDKDLLKLARILVGLDEL